MAAHKQTWRFRALDTWFFRESRPMESIGGSELLSAFPPSPRTIAGAIRTAVGDAHQVDWQQFKSGVNQYEALRTRLGSASHYGQLKFDGPWLAREKQENYGTDGESTTIERLYPVPRHIVIQPIKGSDKQIKSVGRMCVGKPRQCDLGKHVRLPVLANQDRGWRFAEDYWLPAHALQAILAGGCCKPEDLVPTSALFDREARLGIARNNHSRSVEDGLLYQTRHVRPKQSVLIETDVGGLLPGDHAGQGVLRLGGEGRGAAYSVHEVRQNHLPVMPLWGQEPAKGIVLTLLTPFAMQHSDQPASDYAPLPGFSAAQHNGSTVWKGAIQGIPMTLHCVAQGKPVREGGWDLANHQPRPVKSLAPAGSVYYLTVDDGDIEAAAKKLHLTQLPAASNELALGRGLLAVGLWPANEFKD